MRAAAPHRRRPSRQAAKPPNILFILADNLGYSDVNAFAQKATGESSDKMFYETPNLDRLAAGGLAFSQAYGYQLCSPTRASLLTGKNAPSLGFTTATPQTARSFYALDQEAPAGYLALDARYWGDPIKTPQALLNGTTLLALPSGRKSDQGRDELTFAEALTGYRSAFIGKWHVGGVSYLTKKGDTPTTSNAPFKGGKAMMFEGGIRVPLIFRWPAVIPAGNWSDVPVAVSDLFPTLVQAGGIDPETLRAKHKIDGHSLVSLFKDPANKNKGYLRDTYHDLQFQIARRRAGRRHLALRRAAESHHHPRR